MITNLIIWHSSEGKNPPEVLQRLTGLGFRPVTGYYDFMYDHGKEVSINDIMEFSIKVHETLRGTGVLYKLETVTIED